MKEEAEDSSGFVRDPPSSFAEKGTARFVILIDDLPDRLFGEDGYQLG
jgi:hypothetical protein